MSFYKFKRFNVLINVKKNKKNKNSEVIQGPEKTYYTLSSISRAFKEHGNLEYATLDLIRRKLCCNGIKFQGNKHLMPPTCQMHEGNYL